ncbi:hypothetical protein FACS1894163_04200 [Spirochaetia bacterium]|nr:hypothetical protein FACS1894163_04200 [Spirochaetia bacterium]
MSYKDGWAALNLEMPDRVPHTEYSLHMHLDAARKLAGIDATPQSSGEVKMQVRQTIFKYFNYDIFGNQICHSDIFGNKCTKMGHAVYQAGGVDFKDEISALYTDVDEALKWDPWELYGEVDEEKARAQFDQHYQNEVKLNGDLVSMTGIYCTLVSGLIEVFGWDTLLGMAGADPDGFEAVTNRYADWMLHYFKALAKSKAPVVRVHDDMVWTSGAFMNPDWYRKFIFPNYKKLWAPLHEAGKNIVYTCDGNFTQFIDDVVDVGMNAFMMEPTTDMAYIAEKYGKTHAFIGNAETRVLLLGTKDDIRAEVKRCMDIGKKYPGFFMAVGNHIPPNTPVDNVLYYYDAYVEMGKR